MARKQKTRRPPAAPDTLTLAEGVLTFRPRARSKGSPWLSGATLTLAEGEAVPAALVPDEHRHRFSPAPEPAPRSSPTSDAPAGS